VANQEHLDLLKQGVETWNRWQAEHLDRWRAEHPDIPDLSGADLSFADLSFANLSKADLSGASMHRADLSGAKLMFANFRQAILWEANLREAHLGGVSLLEVDFNKANLFGADLSSVDLSEVNHGEVNLWGVDLSSVDFRRANFSGANLSGADLSSLNLSEVNLSGANLSGVNLSRANLSGANLSGQDLSNKDLSGANLSGANLNKAILVGTNLANTTLKDCSIYGLAAWDVLLDGAEQLNLIITPEDQPTITVDNLKIAQFICLLLNNAEIRDVIDTIAKKATLILGRFTPERKAVFDALREALRVHGYLPILFDFEKPSSQDFTETVSTLAHLSRFIIADLTDPSSIPQELYAVVPHRLVPVQPLLKESEDPNSPSREYAMFIDLRKKYHWVLPTCRYRGLGDLLASFETKVIEPAEQKAKELEKR